MCRSVKITALAIVLWVPASAQWKNVTNLPGVNTLAGNLGKDLTTRSNYFTIAGMGTFAGARKIVISVFRRNGNGTANLVSWQED